MFLIATRKNQAPLSLAVVLLNTAALWIGSSVLYYKLVEAMGLQRGYDQAPIFFACYYVFWSALAAAIFWPVLSSRLHPTRIKAHVRAMLPVLILFGMYVAFALPLLPAIAVELAPPNPPEFMFASPWYYLPKSADILFQQILIAGVVFTAARANIGLKKMAIGMAFLFGGLHLLLAFDGFTIIYVARFTIAASIFGLVLPYLYLKTHHGFRWAYGLHWGFYAFDATITHIALSA